LYLIERQHLDLCNEPLSYNLSNPSFAQSKLSCQFLIIPSIERITNLFIAMIHLANIEPIATKLLVEVRGKALRVLLIEIEGGRGELDKLMVVSHEVNSQTGPLAAVSQSRNESNDQSWYHTDTKFHAP